jgi:hypothetical protein
MANRGDQLGEAFVDISGRTENLEKALDRAKRETVTTTREIGDAAERNIGGGFETAAQKIEASVDSTDKLQSALNKAVGSLTGFIGAAAALTGLAAIFFKMGEAASKMARGFRESADAAQEFTRAAQVANLAELTAQMNELHDASTSGFNEVKNFFAVISDTVGLTEAASRDAKLAILEEQRAREQALEFAARQRDLDKKRQEQAREAEVERKEAAAQRKKDEEDWQAFLEEQDRKAKERENERRLQRAREIDALAEDQRRAEEAGRRAGEAFARGMQGQIGGQDFAGPLETLIERIEAKIDELKLSGGGGKR